MPTPMQYNRESVEPWLKQLKPEVRSLAGYTAPPQAQVIAKLNQNENPYDLPQEWKEEILQKMKGLFWTRYPKYSPLDLREKLAQRHGVGPDQILLGNGSNQVLYVVITSIVAPRDPVVISTPTFSLFEQFTQISQGNIVTINRKTDFSDDSDQLLSAAQTAKLTLLCSPNNPTGQAMDPDLLEKILQQTSGLVLWDEAYGEFWGKTAVPLINKYPNLLILRTFSKALGLAGLRTGYLIGHPAMITEFQKANIPYNLNIFSILVALYILENLSRMESTVQKIVNERKMLFEAMKKIPQVTPFPSDANFILFRVPDSSSVLQNLKEKGILVRNVNTHPMLKNCLRVTIGTPDENMAFLTALKNLNTQSMEHGA